MQRTLYGLTMTGFPVASSVNLWNSTRMTALHEGGARMRHLPQARAPSLPQRLAPRFLPHRRVQEVLGRGAALISKPGPLTSGRQSDASPRIRFCLSRRVRTALKDFHGSQSGRAPRLICTSLRVTMGAPATAAPTHVSSPP